MKNILKSWIKIGCDVIVDEEALTNAIKVLNLHKVNSNLKIEKLEWRESNKWSIWFMASRDQIEAIESELKNDKFKEVLVITNTTSFVKVEKLI